MSIVGNKHLLALLVLLWGLPVFAQSVLPQNVIHPRFVFGRVSEVSSRFNDEGGLNSVGRFNQTIDSEFLQANIPEFQNQVDILNNASSNLRLGDEINLGSLKFSGGPTVDYFAPVLAYGVTDKWTTGIAVPIVSLSGGVTVTQTGQNNISEIRSFIASQGTVVRNDVLQAFDRVSDIDLVSEMRKTLKARGYRDLDDRNEQYIGDIQILNFYEYLKSPYMNFYLESAVNLPTGPEDDPDDLIDIPNMHQFGVLLKSHHDFNVNRRWMLGVAPGYFWKAPDTIEKRVPEHEKDLLPKPTRKEILNRDLGDMASLDTYTRLQVFKFLSVNGGVGFYYKQPDSYQGGRDGYQYSLLEKNTESNWIQGKVGGTFSSVTSFQQGEAAIPMMASYNFSDVISGTNVVRQQIHELSFMFFF